MTEPKTITIPLTDEALERGAQELREAMFGQSRRSSWQSLSEPERIRWIKDFRAGVLAAGGEAS